MPSLLWLTDLHLDFVSPERIEALKYSIGQRHPDAILVGGDTGEAPTWQRFLKDLAESLQTPIYYVLGNHDFYRSSIADVRAAATQLTRVHPSLQWLPAAGVVPVGRSTALVGHDGWADARTPEYRTSNVVLNDYLLIDELRAATGADETRRDDVRDAGLSLLTPQLQETLQRLGDESAAYLGGVLPQAAAVAKHLIVLTHPPPFREACWHEGRISDDDWAPHFTCVAVGVALAKFMREHPDHRMTVLCGHTHGEGTAQILPNLRCLTGGARYGHPKVQQAFEVD